MAIPRLTGYDIEETSRLCGHVEADRTRAAPRIPEP